jgi:hypothetical protein
MVYKFHNHNLVYNYFNSRGCLTSYLAPQIVYLSMLTPNTAMIAKAITMLM